MIEAGRLLETPVAIHSRAFRVQLNRVVGLWIIRDGIKPESDRFTKTYRWRGGPPFEIDFAAGGDRAKDGSRSRDHTRRHGE